MPTALSIDDGPSHLPRVQGRDAAWGGVALIAALVVTAAVAAMGVALGGIDYLLLGVPAGTLAVWVVLWAALVRHREWGWRTMGFISSRRSSWHLVWQVPVALVASLVGAALVGAIMNVEPGAERPTSALDPVPSTP